MSSIVFALVLGQGTISQGSVATDPRLIQPMSFDDSLEPINQFVEKASNATGVTLLVDPSLKYLKIDAFVDGQPIGVTLAKAAEAFDLQWQANGDGYKLVQDKATAGQMSDFLDGEEKMVDKAVEKDIAVYRTIDSLVPQTNINWIPGSNRFAGWRTSRDEAKSAVEAAKANGSSEEKLFELEVKFEALDRMYDGTPNLQLARVFGQMSATDVAQYRNGLPYVASNNSNARFKYSEGDIRPNQALPKESGFRSVALTRIDPGSKRVSFKELTFAGKSMAVLSDPASHYPFDEITPSLTMMPFAKKVLAWDQSRSFPKTLTTNLNAESDFIQGWKSPWYGGRFRLGDHLRWFHLVSGMPVIAPADRTIHPFIKFYRGVKSQGEYLTGLLNACNGFGHKSDDFLLVRDGVFWRKSREEIPEQTFANIELTGRRKLTLKDFANFSSKISRSQALLVQDARGFVVKFPRYDFAEAHPALQFIDSLNADQIDSARKPLGLGFGDLSADQQGLFTNGVVDGLINRGFVSEVLLENLLRDGLSLQAISAMKFHIRTYEITTVYEPEIAMDQDKPIELVPRRTINKRPTVNFEFGYDAKRLITFTTGDF